MKIASICVAVLMAVILTSSCEGKEGPAGEDGNANVKVYVSNEINWADVNGDASVFEAAWTVNAIDQITYERDAIFVYVDYAVVGGTIQTQLPMVLTAAAGYNESITSYYKPFTSGANLYLVGSADDGIPTIHDNVTKVKIVIIEGKLGKKELSWDEICQLTNLEYINLD